MRRRRDAHGERVGFAGFQDARDVEYAANEGPLHHAEFVAVEPDVCLVIDPFEDERKLLIPGDFRAGELGAVPVFLFVQALGNCEIVEAVIRIGVDAAINHRRQNGAGYSGGHPRFVNTEIGSGNGCAICGNLRSFSELPSAAQRPLVSSIFVQRCLCRR